MIQRNITSGNIITPDTLIYSGELTEYGRFIRQSFDGFATGKTATVSELMDIFLQQQSEMIQYILAAIADHKKIEKKFLYRVVDCLHNYLQKHGIFFFGLEKFQQKGNRIFYVDHSAIGEFNGSYKIGIYTSNTILTEKAIERFDHEIISYFRQLGYNISIDYKKSYSAGASAPLWIEISSK